jgi:hypothetical protein
MPRIDLADVPDAHKAAAVVQAKRRDGDVLAIPYDAPVWALLARPAKARAIVKPVVDARPSSPPQKHKPSHDPLDRSTWPLAVRLLCSILTKPEDAGLGDVVHRWAIRIGAERVSKWLKRHGLDCGCGDRRMNLNSRFPFQPTGA